MNNLSVEQGPLATPTGGPFRGETQYGALVWLLFCYVCLKLQVRGGDFLWGITT